MVCAFDQVVLDGIGEGVGHLGEDVVPIWKLDDGRGFGGPEVLPAPAESVLVLGEELVESLEEFGHAPVAVNDDRVVMIRMGEKGDDTYVRILGSESQAIDEGIRSSGVRT